MTPKLEFCLLGPVVVRCGEVALPVPRGRQRAVLAVLLLNARRGPVVPRELPGPVPQFVGRAAELAALTRMLEPASAQRPRTPVIPAIAGMAGVGKTALAMQWAHQVADRFPDGQLHVNLRGYDPGQPMSAADALAGFLRSLGVAEQDIPAETGERAARYRSLLAGRRMLIMIDNAGEVEQVRPLLPGSPPAPCRRSPALPRRWHG